MVYLIYHLKLLGKVWKNYILPTQIEARGNRGVSLAVLFKELPWDSLSERKQSQY